MQRDMASALQRFPPTNPTLPEHFQHYFDDDLDDDHYGDYGDFDDDGDQNGDPTNPTLPEYFHGFYHDADYDYDDIDDNLLPFNFPNISDWTCNQRANKTRLRCHDCQSNR